MEKPSRSLSISRTPPGSGQLRLPRPLSRHRIVPSELVGANCRATLVAVLIFARNHLDRKPIIQLHSVPAQVVYRLDVHHPHESGEAGLAHRIPDICALITQLPLIIPWSCDSERYFLSSICPPTTVRTGTKWPQMSTVVPFNNILGLRCRNQDFRPTPRWNGLPKQIIRNGDRFPTSASCAPTYRSPSATGVGIRCFLQVLGDTANAERARCGSLH